MLKIRITLKDKSEIYQDARKWAEITLAKYSYKLILLDVSPPREFCEKLIELNESTSRI